MQSVFKKIFESETFALSSHSHVLLCMDLRSLGFYLHSVCVCISVCVLVCMCVDTFFLCVLDESLLEVTVCVVYITAKRFRETCKIPHESYAIGVVMTIKHGHQR